MVIAPPDTERLPHWRVNVVPPVSAAVNRLPEAASQIVCVPVGVIFTAERFALTVTVTSFETIGDPQVGVDVQTTIQVPVSKLAPVGV